MLTTEQKKMLIEIIKEHGTNFVCPMNAKIMLPVEGIPGADGSVAMEEHEFALVNISITRHDCTENPKREYNDYEFIALDE